MKQAEGINGLGIVRIVFQGLLELPDRSFAMLGLQQQARVCKMQTDHPCIVPVQAINRFIGLRLPALAQ